jgi:phosphatidate cytidylyltransferase
VLPEPAKAKPAAKKAATKKAAPKKSATKKPAGKTAAPKKTPAKKTTTKKTAAKKAVTKKTATKKTATKKPAGKKTGTKKAPAKKPANKKPAAKKPAAKKPAKKPAQLNAQTIEKPNKAPNPEPIDQSQPKKRVKPEALLAAKGEAMAAFDGAAGAKAALSSETKPESSEPSAGASKPSDLPVRLGSAIVMAIVAGAALWLGDWWWRIFVGVVGVIAIWEWQALIRKISPSTAKRVLGIVLGLGYIGLGCVILIAGREAFRGFMIITVLLALVIATDVGAYFAGRAIGGPKIAPALSPSKTWAGLFGGMVLAGIIGVVFAIYGNTIAIALTGQPAWTKPPAAGLLMIAGALAAAVAQAGDFLESWMKRRAGVKDSSNLIPGHGGVLDRIDGLLAMILGFVLYGVIFWGSVG